MSLLGAVFAGTLAELVGIVPMLNVSTALILLAGVVVLRAFPSPTQRGSGLAITHERKT